MNTGGLGSNASVKQAKNPVSLQGYVTSNLVPSLSPKSGKALFQTMRALELSDVGFDGGMADLEAKFLAGYVSCLANVINSLPLPVYRGLGELTYSLFFNMVEDCWSAGIPVLFLRKIPKAMRHPAWITVKEFKNPVIFLTTEDNSLAGQSVALAEALCDVGHCDSGWVKNFLFPEGLEMPKRCSMMKLVEYAVASGYPQELVASYICRLWGDRYKAMRTQVKNYFGGVFDVTDHAHDLFEKKLFQRLIPVPLNLQFLLYSALAADPVAPGSRWDLELDFLLHRITSLRDGLSPSTVAGAKHLVNKLAVFPTQISSRDELIQIDFPGELQVKVYEGLLYEFSSKSGKVGTCHFAEENLHEVLDTGFAALFNKKVL